MAEVGYTRVSSADQNLDRQLTGIELDKTFADRCSGKDTNRPALKQLIEYVREGDHIYVHDISRMARNVADLLDLVKLFRDKKVGITFMKENLTFDSDQENPMSTLLLSLLGSIYQFERAMLLDRQREGVAIAKAAGKYKGKQAVKPLEEIKAAIAGGGKCKDVMAEFDISKAYFYKLHKQIVVAA